MLAGDFFFVTHFQQQAATISAVLEINTTHSIFGGHFPEQPVVPGVCMLQIIKELLEKALGNATRLTRADNLKFLSLIDPRVNSIIQAEINYATEANGNIKATASLFNNDVIFFKMGGQFMLEHLLA